MGSSYITFSTNPNDWTAVEGLYIDQRETESSVTGVNTNRVGIFDQCVRGPTTPQVIASPQDFADLYGGRDAGGGGTITGLVWKAMLNRKFAFPMVACRVAAAAAAKASVQISSNAITGVAATGSITSAAQTDYTDGKILTISDGTHTPTIFEIDKTGNGVGGTNVAVDISGATTANECAIILANAINGVTTTLTVTAGTPSNGTFTLTADTSDATHNVTITTDITATGFTVTGMAGGVTYVAPTATIKIEAANPGVWANGATGYGVTASLTAASNSDANYFDLLIKYGGKTTRYPNFTVYGSTDNCATVIGTSSTRLVNVTKLASGRPANTGADVSLAGGTEGSIAVGDYETAFDSVAAYPGVRVVACGCSQIVDSGNHSTFNAYVMGKASEYPLTTFLVWAGANNTRADEITAKEAQITTPQDNLWWCYNASSTLDRDGNLIETGPHLDMAVILNNKDVAIHPGSEECISLLAGVKQLYNEGLKRADFILLRDAGICALEHVDDGFQFHSCVATSSSGDVGSNTAVEGADVRRTQWLVESMANTIKHDVKKAATESRLRGIKSKLTAFASSDSAAEHVVAKTSSLGPAWLFGFVQTDAEAARNIFKLMAKVRILPYMLSVVMQTEIGTGVTTVSVSNS